MALLNKLGAGTEVPMPHLRQVVKLIDIVIFKSVITPCSSCNSLSYHVALAGHRFGCGFAASPERAEAGQGTGWLRLLSRRGIGRCFVGRLPDKIQMSWLSSRERSLVFCLLALHPQVFCQPPGAAEMMVCAAVLGENRRGALPWRVLVQLAPQLAAWAVRVAMSPSCRPMALRASWRYAAWIENRFGPASAWDRPTSTDDFFLCFGFSRLSNNAEVIMDSAPGVETQGMDSTVAVETSWDPFYADLDWRLLATDEDEGWVAWFFEKLGLLLNLPFK